MKFFIALLAAATFTQAAMAPAQATTLTGGIKYHDVEGRIGVRVNHSGRVFRVHPQSPADVAGIQKGDVITEVDGDRRHIVGRIHGQPGTVVSLTVRRQGEELAFKVPRVEFYNIHMMDRKTVMPVSELKVSDGTLPLSKESIADAAPLLVQKN